MATRGLVIFYVNVNVEFMDKVTPQTLIDLAKENHVTNISQLKDEGWDCMFIPCVGEASRVEKVDLVEDDSE